MEEIEKYKKEFARSGGKARAKKMTEKQRKEHSTLMHKAKLVKKLSTGLLASK